MGPTCAYYEEDSDDALTHSYGPPKVKAQFFYVSSLPIDDPLSPLPQLSGEKVAKHPPQPFSTRDNAALEEAWQAFQQAQDEDSDETGRKKPTSLQRMFSFPEFKNTTKSIQSLSPALENVRDQDHALEERKVANTQRAVLEVTRIPYRNRSSSKAIEDN